MKRLRDDLYVNPQVKRPCGSSARGESFGLPHGPVAVGGEGGSGAGGGGGTGGSGIGASTAAASTQKLTATDALTYLKIVKDMFLDQKEKYDRFLDAMKDFKAQRIDTAGVITRVKELFKGYPNLILGFNTFLPKGYEITLTDEKEAPSKRIVEFEDAISFVNKIKKRFQNDDHVYKSFLAILNMYRKEHKGISEVHQEVAALFEGQSDLLDEFTRFLPDSSALASAPHTRITQSHIDKQLPHQTRINGSHGERDPGFDHPDVDDDKTDLRLHSEDKQHSESESKDERSHDQDGRDHGNEKNGDISRHRLRDESKCTQKGEDFGGNSNLPSNDDKDALKSIYCHEFTFCEKVKERLRSSEDYQAFLNCLHIYSTEIITRKELQCLVADLIGNYPDLMEGFCEFLERCERIDGFLAGVMGKKTLWIEGGRTLKALRIEEKRSGQKHELEGRKEKDRDNIKYCRKSIQELDLSNCESCSPSYRLLPKDCLLPSASHRSDLDARVLNNRWVSVTSGSEDYSFKHMRRNQYEETLFRCEDDRFELDMLLESVSSTAKRAEDLLNSINNNSIGSDSRIIVEDYFTVLNLRCIERLYGEHGLDVMDILRKNAALALPVILTRLKQKQEEWTRCQLDFDKVWAEIYSKNHYKSLDHQCFYFKQLDSKTLSTKSLVSEIKEIKDTNQKEDDMSGSGHFIVPNLEFENTDTEIHEDIYKIIKFSSKEVCSTKEQFNRVLKFWTTFLEPMLGVPSRPDSSEAIEDDSASNHQTVTNILESEGSPGTNATSTNLKQSIPDFIGESSTSIRQINYSWKGFTDVDAVAKDGLTMASNGRLRNTDVVFNTEPDPNYGHGVDSLLANNDTIKEGLVFKARTKDVLSPEGMSILRLNQSRNGKFPEGSRFDGQTADAVDHCKIEKEEGELSPNGDFEDNFGCYQHSSSKSLPKNDGSVEEMQCQTRIHDDISSDSACKNDADVKDKDNAFEPADNVLGGESAAVGCPQEEHGEEKDGEQDSLDGKALSKGEAENTIDAHNIAGDGSSLPPSERLLLTCKPLSKHIAAHLAGDKTKDRRVFYGNDTYYVIFRLHQTLYERIFSAKVNSLNSDSNSRTTKDMNLDRYASFMDALFSLLGGSSDNTKFEDDCRSLIGNQSYVLFTLDKLIYKLVKQLQTVSSEEVDCKLLLLYEYEKSRKQEKFDDSVYYENVNVFLHKENIYRFECTSFPTRLSIQLADDGSDKSGVVPDSVDPNFSAYLSNEYLSVCGEKESSTMMLKRNMRKYANLDECSSLVMATKKVLIRNGLQCKMAATSSKVSYAMHTEDSFIRLEQRRKYRSAERACIHKERSLQFNKYLESSLLRSDLL
ncbi:paired amphipathic helix protein Sin3-like 2 isoform X2 [Henckelia pumila]|uniref:paired amphipathic helix protein Sin3-like 2 isoform X2 n=1 Tax=Henckelia pumila TaxID=405737 RepID=UPI003C6E6556